MEDIERKDATTLYSTNEAQRNRTERGAAGTKVSHDKYGTGGPGKDKHKA